MHIMVVQNYRGELTELGTVSSFAAAEDLIEFVRKDLQRNINTDVTAVSHVIPGDSVDHIKIGFELDHQD